jgi:hypothetical protein
LLEIDRHRIQLLEDDAMTNELHETLERFNSLPDDAVLPSRVTGIILGVSERTIRYHPHLPRVQISRGRYGQRVGDIRKLCREGMPRERGAA